MRDRFKIRLSRKDLRYSNFGRRQLAHERPKDPPASDFRAKTVRPAKPRKRTGANTRTGLEKARRRCQGASEFGPFISSLAFPLIGSCDIVKARERTMPRPREISATGLTTRGHGVRADIQIGLSASVCLRRHARPNPASAAPNSASDAGSGTGSIT